MKLDSRTRNLENIPAGPTCVRVACCHVSLYLIRFHSDTRFSHCDHFNPLECRIILHFRIYFIFRVSRQVQFAAGNSRRSCGSGPIATGPSNPGLCAVSMCPHIDLYLNPPKRIFDPSQGNRCQEGRKGRRERGEGERDGEKKKPQEKERRPRHPSSPSSCIPRARIEGPSRAGFFSLKDNE